MQNAALPPTCPADIGSDCATSTVEWEGEFFPGIPKIKYEVALMTRCNILHMMIIV